MGLNGIKKDSTNKIPGKLRFLMSYADFKVCYPYSKWAKRMKSKAIRKQGKNIKLEDY